MTRVWRWGVVAGQLLAIVAYSVLMAAARMLLLIGFLLGAVADALGAALELS